MFFIISNLLLTPVVPFLLQVKIPFVETSEYAFWAFWLVLIGMAVLLFLLAIVSGAEISYFSLSEKTLQSFKESTNNTEKQVVYLLSKPRNLQITFVIVLRLIKIAFITLAVFMIEHFFEESVEEWFVLVLLLSVILLIFGELVPRIYAHEKQVRFTKRHAYKITASYFIFYPFTKVMSLISVWLEKRVTPQVYDVAIETLPEVLDEIQLEGEGVEKDKQLLREIVNFTTTSIKQVMVPRHKIYALKTDDIFSEVLQKVRDTGFSRVPVYEGTIDNILGVLYLKDLLIHQHQNDSFVWTSLLRPTLVVPENKKIIQVFRQFKAERVHIGIVTDELGTTHGLVTLEDLMEEVLGEIKDEFDEHEVLNYAKVNPHKFEFQGGEPIEVVCQALQISQETFDEVRKGAQTLNGLLVAIWRKIPRKGEEITYQNFKFTVLKANPRMILKVQIEILPKVEG